MLVFYTTGIGGRSMENLINAGFIKGVLDITTFRKNLEETGMGYGFEVGMKQQAAAFRGIAKRQGRQPSG